MKDKFKDTKGLDKAYMSLANHYEERKEKAIRQVKDGAFVDLLNQEMEELQNSMKDKEKQIEEMAKVIAIDRYNNVSSLDTATMLYDDLGYRKLPKDSVVLTEQERISMCVEQWDKGYAKGSKETAEKILFKFESAFAYYDNEDMFSKKAIFECLEEIVKSCGVEIKE